MNNLLMKFNGHTLVLILFFPILYLMSTSDSCKCCPLHCYNGILSKNYTDWQATPCLSLLRASLSLLILGMSSSSEFIPWFSSLQNFLEWCHLFSAFSQRLEADFQIYITIPDLSSECQGHITSYLLSHPCQLESHTISTVPNLLLSMSVIEGLGCWQKHEESSLPTSFSSNPPCQLLNHHVLFILFL